MAWRGWVWVAMMAGMVAGEARAAAVDCWLLDGNRMDQAAGRGLCDDAFSRNSKPGEPPALGPTASLPEPPAAPAPLVTPPRKPAPKASPARVRPVSGGPHAARGMPARAKRSDSGGDFVTNFQRDFGALVDLLTGGPSAGSHRRGDGGSGFPSHSGR